MTLGGVVAAASFPQLPGDPPKPPGADPHTPLPDIVTVVLDDIPPLDGRLWKRLPNIRQNFVRQGLRLSLIHISEPTIRH